MRRMLCIWLLMGAVSAAAQGLGFSTSEADVQRTLASERKVNYGFRLGFTSTLFMVPDLVVGDEEIDKIQNNYKIGYVAAFYSRINLRGHSFVQLECALNHSRGQVVFGMPGSAMGMVSSEIQLESDLKSIDIPVLYGYHVVKEGPYRLSLFAGPKAGILLKHYNKKSLQYLDYDMHENLFPVNLNMTVGASVSITKLFFDFRYDVGVTNISRGLTYTLPGGTTSDMVRFHRRDNILSFSVGFLL